MSKLTNVGIMGNSFRPMAGLDSVYGYDVAVNDNMNALLKYGSFETMNYYYEPMNFQEAVVKRKYRSLVRKDLTSVKLNMISEYDLMNKKNDMRIDVLHTLGMEFMPQIYCREVLACNPFPVTYMIHGASYPYYINSFYLMKLLMPFEPYDSLICTSKAVRSAVQNTLTHMEEDLAKAGQAKIKYEGRLDVLPLGTDTTYFQPKDRKESREMYQIPNDAFVLLWIGRLSAYDKADLLPVLTAFRRLVMNNQDKVMRLVIAGHDRKQTPFLPVMKQYAKDLGIGENILLLENHDMANRQYLFSAADVFISPIDNIQETFGLTPIEAMACGVPQVVSDWDGYKDTVIDGLTGFRIPTYWAKCDGDITESGMLPSEPMHRSVIHHFMVSQAVAVDLEIFNERIQALIDNPTLLKQMSVNSVKVARESFEWERLIPKYEELWTELKEQCDSSNQVKCSRKTIDFIRPRYCEYFSEYPTRFVEQSEFVKVTLDGHKLLSEEFPLPKHYEIEDVLGEKDIALEILRFMEKNEVTMLGDAHKQFCQYHEAKVVRCYMWLMKHGFIVLTDKRK